MHFFTHCQLLSILCALAPPFLLLLHTAKVLILFHAVSHFIDDSLLKIMFIPKCLQNSTMNFKLNICYTIISWFFKWELLSSDCSASNMLARNCSMHFCLNGSRLFFAPWALESVFFPMEPLGIVPIFW